MTRMSSLLFFIEPHRTSHIGNRQIERPEKGGRHERKYGRT